jgi:arylsulfatase A-like enzyme
LRLNGIFGSVPATRPAPNTGRIEYRTPTKPVALPVARAAFPLGLILFGALLSGLGEFAVRLLVLRWSPYLDRSFQFNPQAIWMGPLAALPVVALVVTISWLIGSRSRHAALQYGLPRGAVFFIAALQVGLTTSRVHWFALAMLALGAAFQLTRWMVSRQAAANALVQRATVLLILVSAGGGLGWRLWKRVAEARAQGGVPAPAQAPNVLMLILDTVGARELSLYGYGRPTSPSLARFAADGIRFDRAAATASWTLPSHASFFTGRYPHELNVGWAMGLDDRDPTLAGEFSRSGYATAGFAANPYYGSARYGLGRGFQHYSDFAVNLGEILSNSNLNRRLERLWNDKTPYSLRLRHRNAASINDDLLDWIDRRPAERPFFAFVNYIDAHSPYLPPSPYRSMYSGSASRKWLVKSDDAEEPPPPEVIKARRDAYDGAITYLDSQLGALFHELDVRGLTGNTIVLVSADHGESLGEHGFLEHGVSLYLTELQVPLIIRLPGKAHAGCVVQEWVTLRDIPATLTSAAALPAPTLPGQSLIQRCLAPGTPPRFTSPVLSETVGRKHLPSWYPASTGDLGSLIFGDLHYLKGGSSIELLFDTSRDLAERNDLSRDPAYADSLALARRLMSSLRR